MREPWERNCSWCGGKGTKVCSARNRDRLGFLYLGDSGNFCLRILGRLLRAITKVCLLELN